MINQSETYVSEEFQKDFINYVVHLKWIVEAIKNEMWIFNFIKLSHC